MKYLLQRLSIFGLATLCLSVQVLGQLNIIGSIPAMNSNHVPNNAFIEITFDDNIDPGTLNSSTIVVRGDQSGVITGTLSGGATPTITFNPDNNFKPGELISVTITDQLFSLLGIPLARGFTFSFTALTTPPPSLPMTFAQRNIAYGSNFSARDVKALDYDRDGIIDIMAATEGLPEITSFVQNDGAGNFCGTRLADFRYVQVYDLDGDGDFDSFGATGSFDTELNWFENEGSTPFTERFISALDPWTIGGGDLDSDGDIDALAFTLPIGLAWFANDGIGNFSGANNIPTTFTGGSDSFIEVVDVNSDGAMDILSYHLNDQNLVWYENDGSQNLTEILIENTTNRQRPSLGDLDDDGDMDIISTSTAGTPELNWYQNDGNENFTKIPVATTSTQTMEQAKIVDLDGDMDMDILSGKFWYENDGNENFTERQIIDASNFLTSVNYGDLDNDGDLDLFAAGRFRWFENGLFMNVTSITPDNATTGVSTSPINVVFDQNIDPTTVNPTNVSIVSDLRGKLNGNYNVVNNLVAFIPSGNFIAGERIEVSVNEKVLSLSGHSLTFNYGFSFSTASTPGTPTFAPVPVFTHSTIPTGLDLGDIDLDGDLDIVTSTVSELFWHENDGNGNFTQIPIPISGGSIAAFILDQNGDGFMDIVVDQGGFNPTLLFLNDGAQNFTESNAPVGNLDLFQSSDFNHDGDMDFIWLNANDDRVGWSDSECGGYTSSGTDIFLIASRDVKSEDMDNDGDSDLIGVSFAGTTLYQNDGFYNFPNSPIDPTNAADVTIADLDGDQDFDLIVLESSFTITWYENRLNEASMDFGSRQVISPVAADARELATGDLDGDFDIDIIILSPNDDNIVWHENRLDEASNDFSGAIVNTGFSDRPDVVSVGDLNGDGDLDIVVISGTDDELSYYENISSACVSISIIQEPVDTDVCIGDQLDLFVDAAGDAPITFQWQIDGVDIPGEVSNTLSIDPVNLGDAGDYQCMITNPCGVEFSAIATVTVDEPVIITSEPQSQTVPDGGSVTLDVVASGTLPIFQWQKDGIDIPGATNPSLTIDPFFAADEGDYTCVIDNICNMVTSAVATLILQAPALDFIVFDNQQSQELTNGQVSPVDFGQFNLQDNAQRDFDIENVGGSDIIINDITSNDPSFTISNIPATVPDASTETFTITLNTSLVGVFNGDILIDSDVGSFLFPVSGEVLDPPVSGELIIYNALAPDGNGQNDYFKIENIELFTPNKVEIYNRWGDMVFEISDYDNQLPNKRFEGQSNVSGTKDLIEGNYFYVIITDQERLSGYLFLRR